MDFKTPNHNTPSATLIKNYLNKKSGKVVESRREIQRRFLFWKWMKVRNYQNYHFEVSTGAVSRIQVNFIRYLEI